MQDLVVDSKVTISGSCLEWTACRASGAGGQRVNKVSTKVDLRFDLASCSVLDSSTKSRLRLIVGPRSIDADGRIIVTSQANRTQERNLEDACEKLRGFVAAALVRPKRRRATRPTLGSRRRRLQDKRERSDKKRDRSRVDLD